MMSPAQGMHSRLYRIPTKWPSSREPKKDIASGVRNNATLLAGIQRKGRRLDLRVAFLSDPLSIEISTNRWHN